jgi:hypothetical protein
MGFTSLVKEWISHKDDIDSSECTPHMSGLFRDSVQHYGLNKVSLTTRTGTHHLETMDLDNPHYDHESCFICNYRVIEEYYSEIPLPRDSVELQHFNIIPSETTTKPLDTCERYTLVFSAEARRLPSIALNSYEKCLIDPNVDETWNTLKQNQKLVTSNSSIEELDH